MIRFAYGCLPSLPSLYFANYFIRRCKLRPACIVLSDGGLRFKGRCYPNSKVLPLLLRNFGARFTFYQVLLGLGALLGSGASKETRLWSFQQLAREFDIPLHTSVDFSGAATLHELERLQIDLFVTCMCDQIVRAPLLSMPHAGCVNIHFSLLPDFRGVDSIFQSMLCGVSQMGVTLHRTASRIDAGDVISQLAFERTREDSHLRLLTKGCVAAAKLLQEHVQALERGETPAAAALELAQARFPYRSWPDREELQRFRAQGLAYWRKADFTRMLGFEDLLADTILQPAARIDTQVELG